MGEGWIAVYRSLLNKNHDLHPFSNGDKACRWAAWIDLIGLAKWEDTSDLERGQLKMKQRTLAHRWNWSRSKVKRFLTQLENDGRIVRDPQTGPKPTVVTVCNYDDYQFARPQTDHKPTRDPTTYSYKEEEKQKRGRTPARDNGKPAGPGDLTVTRRECPNPECGGTLRRNAMGLYCVACGIDKLEASA